MSEEIYPFQLCLEEELELKLGDGLEIFFKDLL